MKPKVDLKGQRCGRLVVVKYVGRRDGSHYWTCVCDCGRRRRVSAYNLVPDDKATKKRRGTRSCGCLVKNNPDRPVRKSIYECW
jgi:hypothetical protein